MVYYSRLAVPSFDTLWIDIPINTDEHRKYCLVPGGGGSAKTGIKNIIQSFAFNNEDYLTDHSVFDTIYKNQSMFCSSLVQANFKQIKFLIASTDHSIVIIDYLVNKEKNLVLDISKSYRCIEDTNGDNSITCLTFHNYGIIAVGTEKHKIQLFKLRNIEDNKYEIIEDKILEGEKSSISSITSHPTEPIIVTGYKNGWVYIWDIITGEVIQRYNPFENNKNRSECRCISFSNDGSELYTIHNIMRDTSQLFKWNLKHTNKKWTIVKASSVILGKIPTTKLCINNKLRYIALGDAEGTVKLLDEQTLATLEVFRCHQLPVTGLTFAPFEYAEKIGVKAIINSCSADNALTTIHIKNSSSRKYLTFLFILLLSLVALILTYVILFGPVNIKIQGIKEL